jgi:hypothetical protein
MTFFNIDPVLSAMVLHMAGQIRRPRVHHLAEVVMELDTHCLL